MFFNFKANALDYTVNLGLLSYHLTGRGYMNGTEEGNKYQAFNEINKGLGLKVTNGNEEYAMGSYLNSYFETSKYIAITKILGRHGRDSLKSGIMFADNYKKVPNLKGITAFPYISFTRDHEVGSLKVEMEYVITPILLGVKPGFRF